MARGQRRRMSPQTLNTTGLVHEAYLKLVDQSQANWQDRSHFYAVCAIAMRQILINHVEKNQAKKRGGGCQHVEFHDNLIASDVTVEALLDINRALQWLEGVDERLAKIVEYRFFAGMTEAEIAQVMGYTGRTIRREWCKAKALLSWALANPEEQEEQEEVCS